MTLMKKVFIICTVLIMTLLLVIFNGPAIHHFQVSAILRPDNQTIYEKLWILKNQISTNRSQTQNLKSLIATTPSRVGSKVKTRKTSKPKIKQKYLIYSCKVGTCGGFGDRQRGIISTFLLANLTKRRFGLMLTKPCDIRQYLYPNEVQWDIPRKQLTKLKTQLVKMTTRKSVRAMASIDFNKRYKADVVYLQTNYILRDLLKNNSNYKSQMEVLANTSYDQYFAEMYEKIFKPGHIIARKLKDFLEKSKVGNETKLICAQIRIGRNPTMPQDDVRNRKSTVNVVWDFLRRYNDTRHYKIFVTTDSEEIRNKAKRLFPEQVLDSKGKIIHVDFHRRPSATICQGVEKVLLDQYILSNCDVLIHSRSNFGENAARLKKKHSEIYIFQNGRISPSSIV